MTNFILTNTCNAHCSFCFAADWLKKEALSAQRMSMRQFQLYLDYVLANGMKELRLLGGEPCIHPDFAEFIKAGRQNDMHITVFSNGVMPEAALSALCELSAENCSVIINMNAAINPEQRIRNREVLRQLGARAIPGVTITDTAFSLEPLVENIEMYQMKKIIRLGLSQPITGAKNHTLHPKLYPAIGEAILRQSSLTAAHGISLDPDCGFVRCMFPSGCEAELNANRFLYHSSCTPILDLCSDGTILFCFALAEIAHVPFQMEKSMRAVGQELDRQLQAWKTCGVYAECGSCQFFHTEQCCGGCLSAVIRRFRPVRKDALPWI